jgi:hypothetical protein
LLFVVAIVAVPAVPANRMTMNSVALSHAALRDSEPRTKPAVHDQAASARYERQVSAPNARRSRRAPGLSRYPHVQLSKYSHR